MIRARGTRIVVKCPKTQSQTDSGLYIPGMEQEDPQEGIVMSKGPGCVGDFIAGDRVVFDQYAGLEMDDGDWGSVIILEERDLSAIIHKEDGDAISQEG